ncbi:MAG: imidazolonepropionase [Gammaproteobacteria bacterium]|nr:imidazolonepropionase [Gammaproteobacteria bacterium]
MSSSSIDVHDLIVKNARLYPMAGDVRPAAATSFAVSGGRISALPASGEATSTIDAGGRVVLPGLIDCHTHALYAGDRMAEHKRRLEGATYAQIAREGGGISSTVRAVRAASEDQLVEQTLPRVAALAREGVTTIEIKSGYGLTTSDELKMLRAIGSVARNTEQRIVPTFLGAHAIPAESGKEKYVAEICQEMLPAVAEQKLSDTCDIYIESIAFDQDAARTILERAAALGLQRRAHTEQLSNSGGTALAAALGALSCDHLECAEDDDIQAMGIHGAVAVLLPGAYYFLREIHRPPLASLHRHKVPIAVASDLNPGTSPIASLLTAMHMATIMFGLTADEALLGVTQNAARALGKQDNIGTLEVGKLADFSLWDIPAPEFLLYRLGGITPEAVYINGQPV